MHLHLRRTQSSLIELYIIFQLQGLSLPTTPREREAFQGTKREVGLQVYVRYFRRLTGQRDALVHFRVEFSTVLGNATVSKESKKRSKSK
jgi:hypothetical protein